MSLIVDYDSVFALENPKRNIAPLKNATNENIGQIIYGDWLIGSSNRNNRFLTAYRLLPDCMVKSDEDITKELCKAGVTFDKLYMFDLDEFNFWFEIKKVRNCRKPKYEYNDRGLRIMIKEERRI